MEILENLNSQLPSVYSLMMYIFGAIGYSLCGIALWRAAAARGRGEPIMGKTIVTLIVAGFFNGFSEYMGMASDLAFATDPRMDLYTTGNFSGTAIVQTALMFGFNIVFLVGLWAMAYSLLLFMDVVHKRQPTFWRGMTHFVFGAVAANLDQFLTMIGDSAGAEIQDFISSLII